MLRRHIVSEYPSRICKVILIGMRASFVDVDEMPQENYTLIGFSWDRSLEKIRKKIGNKSSIVGDATDEAIDRNHGKLCLHIKIKKEKVSFHITRYGNLQISHENSELLRRAKSRLSNVLVATRWIPKNTNDIEEPDIVNKLKGLKLNDLEIEWLFPWYYYFLPSHKRGSPPNRRLLRKISTNETFDAPIHDLELFRNEIIAHQNHIRFPFESSRRWSRRHGYNYRGRQYTEDELMAEE